MLTFVMGLGEVPQLEVDQACEEREAALDRKLKDWERKLVKAYLTNHKLKELTPEERLYFWTRSYVSASYNLNI